MIGFKSTKNTLYIVCILSGLLTSCYVLVDTIVLVKFIPDAIVFGYQTIIGGLIISLLIWLLLFIIPLPNNKKLGQLFEPRFGKISYPSKEIIKYILIASVFNAGGMLIYFLAVQSFNPSLILPLMQFTILYLMIAEFIAERDLPTIVEIQAITMITLGAFTLTINPELEFDFLLILLTLGPLNLFSGLNTYFQKKASAVNINGKTIDSLTLRLLSVVSLAIVFGIIGFPLLLLDNRISMFIETLGIGILFAMISMGIAFFSYAFWLRGLSIGKTYIVNALVAVSIVFSIPLTLVVIVFEPSLLAGELTTDLFSWIMRIIGSILVFIGIFALAITESRGYILAKTRIGSLNSVMEELSKINGVVSVCSILGEYDLIIAFRIRSTGKLLRLIMRKIASIEGIESINTQIILKRKEKD